MKLLKQALLCILLAFDAAAQERLDERAPLVENGKTLALEVVIFKPPGAGPFPTLMFNHGSTGRGDDPALFGRTSISESIARFFNEHGWLVAFPQRRGRGRSEGLYDEGFQRNRQAGYACDARLSLPGMERALQDLDAAFDYLKARSDVDARRMLIGGQSRGGILAIVYAGTRPDRFRGALNFAGGWTNELCADRYALNTESFKRGAAFPGPTLWLYGERDRFYSAEYSRGNFEAFTAAGGRGRFLAYPVGAGADGHFVIRYVDLWREPVAALMEETK